MSDLARPRRVLVVDDDEQLRYVLSETMTEDGYEVQAASNGREAIAIMQSWHPDLIVLDLMMPVMDGAAFRQEQLRLGLDDGVPLIVLSAAREMASLAERVGAAAAVPKPFELDELLATVERLASVPDV
jgi:CheY-like chemotaxis protein